MDEQELIAANPHIPPWILSEFYSDASSRLGEDMYFMTDIIKAFDRGELVWRPERADSPPLGPVESTSETAWDDWPAWLKATSVIWFFYGLILFFYVINPAQPALGTIMSLAWMVFAYGMLLFLAGRQAE